LGRRTRTFSNALSGAAASLLPTILHSGVPPSRRARRSLVSSTYDQATSPRRSYSKSSTPLFDHRLTSNRRSCWLLNAGKQRFVFACEQLPLGDGEQSITNLFPNTGYQHDRTRATGTKNQQDRRPAPCCGYMLLPACGVAQSVGAAAVNAPPRARATAWQAASAREACRGRCKSTPSLVMCQSVAHFCDGRSCAVSSDRCVTASGDLTTPTGVRFSARLSLARTGQPSHQNPSARRHTMMRVRNSPSSAVTGYRSTSWSPDSSNGRT